MTKIKTIKGNQIADSKGEPTLQVMVELEDGSVGVAGVPSGASTGTREVVELRDADEKGVGRAVEIVEGELGSILIGMEGEEQAQIDEKMVKADGTVNLSKLGGNSVVGISMAVCKAMAKSDGVTVYRYINGLLNMGECVVPKPMFLLMEGGRHGEWATDIQEFMIMAGDGVFSSLETEMAGLMKVATELESLLKAGGIKYQVGYEGALVPENIGGNRVALQIIKEAVKRAGFELGRQIIMGVDVAASEFFHAGVYGLRQEARNLTSVEWSDEISRWVDEFKLGWVEDPFDESAWSDWTKLQTVLGKSAVLVGDDLVVTRKNLIRKAIKKRAMGGVIIKPNQVGTVTDTLDSVRVAKQHDLWVVISHRGSETMDDFVADLAVGVGAKAGKFGGHKQKERMAKYQRLQVIAGELA